MGNLNIIAGKMQVLKIIQGSDQWKSIRGEYLVASEAPVIMGASPYMKRDDLLAAKKNGSEREFSDWLEKFVLKKGHDSERAIRPIAEYQHEISLFPLTATRVINGLKFLASFDGINAPTFSIHWEHKQINQKLLDFFNGKTGRLDPLYYWQLEHQMLVAGTDSCLFACSDGTDKNYYCMEYTSYPSRREALIEGWKIFIDDLSNYTPPEEKPEFVTQTISSLPTLVIDISGEVKSSNLAIYKANAIDYIERINTNLQTDEDFANAKLDIKFCESAAKELLLVKQQTLSKSANIDEIMRTIDTLFETMKKKRLFLEKLVTSEEKSRKDEIVKECKLKLSIYIDNANEDLEDFYPAISLPFIPESLDTAGKGRKTLETYRKACNDELANAKNIVNTTVNHIKSLYDFFDVEARDHKFLFSDIQNLIGNEQAAFEAIVKNRISEHLKFEADKKAITEPAKTTDYDNPHHGDPITGELITDRVIELGKSSISVGTPFNPLEAHLCAVKGLSVADLILKLCHLHPGWHPIDLVSFISAANWDDVVQEIKLKQSGDK